MNQVDLFRFATSGRSLRLCLACWCGWSSKCIAAAAFRSVLCGRSEEVPDLAERAPECCLRSRGHHEVSFAGSHAVLASSGIVRNEGRQSHLVALDEPGLPAITAGSPFIASAFPLPELSGARVYTPRPRGIQRATSALTRRPASSASSLLAPFGCRWRALTGTFGRM